MSKLFDRVLGAKVSRRDFLKGSAAATAAVAGLSLAGCSNNTIQETTKAPEETTKAPDTTTAADDAAQGGFPVWLIVVIVVLVIGAGVAVIIIVKNKKKD